MNDERKITKKETKLPINCQLRTSINHGYVIQVVLAVSATHPRWCDVYWHVLEEALRPWKDSKNRIGSGDDHPTFDDLYVAKKALSKVKRIYGKYQVRLIRRHETIQEELVE